MDRENVLEILERSGALLHGHFELRSKLHSGQYFQCANVLRYPREAARLCEALAERMSGALGAALRAETVVAPAMGGIIVGHEVARVLDCRSIFTEKQDGKLVLRRFALRPGERCVVAEDVVTRGGRVQETIDIVKAAGAVVAAMAVLVDRSGGKARFDEPLFSLLEMEPIAYEPGACPLCAKGLALVHPGS